MTCCNKKISSINFKYKYFKGKTIFGYGNFIL